MGCEGRAYVSSLHSEPKLLLTGTVRVKSQHRAQLLRVEAYEFHFVSASELFRAAPPQYFTESGLECLELLLWGCEEAGRD